MTIRALPRPITANPAQFLVFALLGTLVALSLIAVSTHWYFEDAGAYWQGAMRLRSSGPLYVDHLIDPELYRYAPWFAFAWVPLTFLPEPAVMVAWGTVLVVAAAYLVWPDWRNPYSMALSLLIFPDLARVTSTGNVQPLLLALIAWSLRSRWGPQVVGAMASLKAFPLAFAAYYVWKREWWRATLTVAVTIALVLPMLAFDLSDYPARQLVTPGILSILLVIARLARSPEGWPGRSWLAR